MLRRRSSSNATKLAAVFAGDLLQGCAELFAVFGGETLRLPISIPIDDQGLVLLQPGGPLDAPRVAAEMTVTRPLDGAYGIRIERTDGGPMIIPGLGGTPLTTLQFVVTAKGLDIGPGPLDCDETTARALATALLITIGMKLTKARRPG